MSWDQQIADRLITEWVPEGSRVLDLGCGAGELLVMLEEQRKVTGIGVEISTDMIAECIERGLNVIQDDIEGGLGFFSADSFDCLILSRTLQEMHNPTEILRGILQVGKRAIVSIENAGHLRKRLQFLFGHQQLMEGTGLQHQITIVDFERLCAQAQLRITQKRYLTRHGQTKWPLLAEIAVYQLEKAD